MKVVLKKSSFYRSRSKLFFYMKSIKKNKPIHICTRKSYKMRKTVTVNNKTYTCNFGEGKYYTVHKNIEIRQHPKFSGYGLFATGPIRKDEVIWADEEGMKDKTKIYTSEQLKNMKREERNIFYNFGYQVGEDLFIGPITNEEADEDVSNYTNHSCDPNTWLISDYCMLARRDIKTGDEITMDYGTIAPIKEFDCMCGTKYCRGRVKKNDFLNEELIARYGEEHFLEWMRRKIRDIVFKK